MDFSLMYFSSSAGGEAGPAAYRLLLDGARFADAHGFKAVWTPERHFHEFGGLFPNPAVTNAALAGITQNIGSICFYKSVLTGSGSIYSILASLRLQGPDGKPDLNK